MAGLYSYQGICQAKIFNVLRARNPALLADAEAAEDPIQDVVGVNGADYAAALFGVCSAVGA
jgi:hypothetical protein